MLKLSAFLFIILGSVAAAQVPADSLRVVWEAAELPPAEKLPFLQTEYGNTIYRSPRTALALARISLDVANELDDAEGRCRAHKSIGIAYYYLGNYSAALRCYETTLAMARESNLRVLEGDALNNIGILYFVWGEHDLALEHYLENLAIQLEMESDGGAARCYNNIAGIQHSAGNYDSALANYRRALALYRKMAEVSFVASTMNNIGLVLYDTGDFVGALDNLEAALALERDEGDRAGEALSLNNMGRIRGDQGRDTDAQALLDLALAIRREIGDRQGESVSLQLLGTILTRNGEPKRGIALLEEALGIAEELEVRELISDDLLALSRAHESLGKFEIALVYYRRYKEARDIIFDEERSRNISAAQARFESDLKDQEISNLRQEAEFELFRRRILLIAAALSLVIVMLLFNRYRFQKKAHSKIHTTNEELSRAHARLEKAAREELVHVARVVTMGELAAAFAHELNQPLAAIKANARAARNLLARSAEMAPHHAEDHEVDEALVDIRDDAERATEIILRLREMMRKGEVRREDHDLNTIIRSAVEFVGGLANRQGIEIQQQLASGLPILRCDKIQIQQVMINLIQNGLSAMGELGGTIVIRTAISAPDSIAVEVIDQGPAVSAEVVAEMFDPFFTTKPQGLGMGLTICRTIIEAHGGTLEAARGDGGGLKLRFVLPIQAESGLSPLLKTAATAMDIAHN